jgi:hypothetical protein
MASSNGYYVQTTNNNSSNNESWADPSTAAGPPWSNDLNANQSSHSYVNNSHGNHAVYGVPQQQQRQHQPQMPQQPQHQQQQQAYASPIPQAYWQHQQQQQQPPFNTPPSVGSLLSHNSHNSHNNNNNWKGSNNPGAGNQLQNQHQYLYPPPSTTFPSLSLSSAPPPPPPPLPQQPLQQASSYHQYAFDQAFMVAAKALPPMRPPPPPPPPNQMLVPQQAIRRPINQNKRNSNSNNNNRKRPHESSAPSSPLSNHKPEPGSVSSPESVPDHSYHHLEAAAATSLREAQWTLGLQPKDPRALPQDFKKLAQTPQVVNNNDDGNCNSKPAETISLLDLDLDLEKPDQKSSKRKPAQNETIDLTDDANELGQINPQREVIVSAAPTGTLPNYDHASADVASKSSFTASDSSTELQDNHGRTNKKRRFPHESKSSSNMSESSAESQDKKRDTLEKSFSETSSSLALNDKSTSASDTFHNKIINKKKKSQEALELMRAKLMEAKRMNKLAAQGNIADAEPPQDSKAKLARARLTLRGALKNREKALNRMNNQVIPPISAFQVDLIIQNIGKTGPEDMVYYPAENGLDLVRKCLPHVPEQPPDDPQSQDLYARKSQLQLDLDALKQRLALRQKKKQPEKVSKEELERRRVQAQAFMDVSYWKHFVSKQQHLLAEVTEQIEENQKVLDQCTAELKDTNQSLDSSTAGSADLELRRTAVTAMAEEKTYKLVELRNRLYSLQEDKKKAKNKCESEEEAVKNNVAAPETGDLQGADTDELDPFADTPLDQTTTELEEKVYTLLETPARDLEQFVEADE